MTTSVRKTDMERRNEAVLIGLHSEWIGDSQFRVRVRKIGTTDKLIAEVMELSHGRVARKGTAQRVASRFVRQFGVASVDATVLSENSFTKKSQNLDGDVLTVKVRHSAFVFHGANS